MLVWESAGETIAHHLIWPLDESICPWKSCMLIMLGHGTQFFRKKLWKRAWLSGEMTVLCHLIFWGTAFLTYRD